MQNINLQLEDEEGNIIEKAKGNFADIISVLERIESYARMYPWLSTVDPYGYTVFNIRQTPKLIAELAQLKGDLTEKKKILNEIDNAVFFLEKVEQHLYIRFVGD